MSYRRRLSDKILNGHKQACESGNVEVAEVLLRALEQELTAIGGGRHDRRTTTAPYERAYERQQRLTGRH